MLLANLGDLVTKRREYVEAEQYYTERSTIARDIGHGWWTQWDSRGVSQCISFPTAVG